MDNTTNINDNIEKFSEIFKSLDLNDKSDKQKVTFVSTEKWINQLGRRINS